MDTAGGATDRSTAAVCCLKLAQKRFQSGEQAFRAAGGQQRKVGLLHAPELPGALHAAGVLQQSCLISDPCLWRNASQLIGGETDAGCFVPVAWPRRARGTRGGAPKLQQRSVRQSLPALRGHSRQAHSNACARKQRSALSSSTMRRRVAPKTPIHERHALCGTKHCPSAGLSPPCCA